MVDTRLSGRSRQAFKEQYDAFRLRNPLCVWREKNGVGVTLAGRMLQTNKTNIGNWENGYVMPSDRWWDKLANLMGKTVASLEKEWNAWWDTKPSLH